MDKYARQQAAGNGGDWTACCRNPDREEVGEARRIPDKIVKSTHPSGGDYEQRAVLAPLKCANCDGVGVHVSGADNVAGRFSFVVRPNERAYAEWLGKYEQAKHALAGQREGLETPGRQHEPEALKALGSERAKRMNDYLFEAKGELRALLGILDEALVSGANQMVRLRLEELAQHHTDLENAIEGNG